MTRDRGGRGAGTVVVIPARGGSKRLPRKNVLPFAGLPLVAHSILQARSVPEVALCVVSTDDPEIAGVARSYGAEVLMRPKELASDTATTASVVRHALEQVGEGGFSNAVVTLQPTCPLRPVALVSEALRLFAVGDCDSVVSVTLSREKAGLLVDGWFEPEYTVGARSQDLPARYFENGLVYVSRADRVRAGADLFGERVRPLPTDPLYAAGDIDTELDFLIAEFLFRRFHDRFATAQTVQEGKP